MNGKTAKRVRKLQRKYGYTGRQYRFMKRVRSGMNIQDAQQFNYEVDMIIDRRH